MFSASFERMRALGLPHVLRGARDDGWVEPELLEEAWGWASAKLAEWRADAHFAGYDDGASAQLLLLEYTSVERPRNAAAAAVTPGPVECAYAVNVMHPVRCVC